MSWRKWLILLCLVVAALTMVSSVAASEAQFQATCYQPARLIPGGQARVTLYPNAPNRVRNQPSFQGRVLGYIPAGGVFQVLAGPYCSGQVNWWQVNYNGLVGYTAEGNGAASYWLEPMSGIPPGCVLPNRLTIGGLGRVTPGLPNVLKNLPGPTGTVIGNIPAGGVFQVLAGPQCAGDNRWWWQVNYNGLVGWTGEGEGYNHYWVEPLYSPPNPTLTPIPVSCSLPTRLNVGGYGRVTPGLPNVVRNAPGTASTGANSVAIGQIPGGGVFYVASGPSCGSDGRWWWYINYQGLIGWTAEGDPYSGYWTEPF
jgi:hypothetical protein